MGSVGSLNGGSLNPFKMLTEKPITKRFLSRRRWADNSWPDLKEIMSIRRIGLTLLRTEFTGGLLSIRQETSD